VKNYAVYHGKDKISYVTADSYETLNITAGIVRFKRDDGTVNKETVMVFHSVRFIYREGERGYRHEEIV